MDKTILVQIERELLEYKRQFTSSYNRGENVPYGSNKEQRQKSEDKYKSAMFLASSLCHRTGLYDFLEDKGFAISLDNHIWKKSKAGDFEYDVNKLLDAIKEVKRIVE